MAEMNKLCPFSFGNPTMERTQYVCLGLLCALYSREKSCCAPLAILDVMTAPKLKAPAKKTGAKE